MATHEAPGGSPADRLRLARIEIEDYKAIAHLALDFPPPSTPEELDVFVIGSRNGVGKTSVLECCALVVLGAVYRPLFRRLRRMLAFDPGGLLIRSGSDRAKIQVRLEWPQAMLHRQLDMESSISPAGTIEASVRIDSAGITPARSPDIEVDWYEGEHFVDSIFGLTSEPVVAWPTIFLHSYRKVREGHASLGAVTDLDTEGPPLSRFKRIVIRALMARGGLFEDAGDVDLAAITALNLLMRAFAGGKVDKLKPTSNGNLDLRVAPVGGGPSYSFDGLSSGQKEVIATLFLIWHATRDHPSIVLIDEPELHLNAEWQRLFVRQLGEIAPHNQYIMATHSEEIFASVPAERRLMLEPE